jgi:GTP-binding protein LepA
MTENIRNFVIISHVDHGKSTLADRFLELTKTVEPRQMKPQFLDRLESERERGITIKMAPVRMIYHSDRRPPQTETQTDADNDFLYKDTTYKIRGATFLVKRNLGLGQKEIIYQRALEEEFRRLNLTFEREKIIDLWYGDKKLGIYKPDFLIEKKIIVEVKALPFVGQTEEKQLWGYLKNSPYKLALLINFGGKDVEIKRVVYDTARLRGSASSQRESAQVEKYILNLIDTPGHSDFSYEVSRALAAVEGAILLVDVSQGIQAQTLVNLRLAQKAGLKIIGAVNKIDLFSDHKEMIEKAAKELAELLNVSKSEIFRISGKTGDGVEEILEAVTRFVPPPQETATTKSLSQALVFDSFYDDHKGIIAFVRVMSGEYQGGKEVQLLAANYKFKIKEVGYFLPDLKSTKILGSGEIGYIATGLKNPDVLRIGDTIGLPTGGEELRGYKEPKPVVFVSLYPDNPNEYEDFKSALFKLKLNDSSLNIEPDLNEVLGRGFKCGFLGQLHFEITAERLEKEFKIKTISTFPFVAYKVRVGPRFASMRTGRSVAPAATDALRSRRGDSFGDQARRASESFSTKQGEADEYRVIKNIENLPSETQEIWEPTINVSIISPRDYMGNVLNLKDIFRLSDIRTQNFENRVIISAQMPLSTLLSDFDGQLKSVSQGMASFSYEIGDYKKADLEKAEILVAGEPVPGLSRLMYKDELESESRKLLSKLKEILPRQQFSQALQAKAGGQIIARENIPALRKDVTGYLYGGDRTRKMKLWKKQQRGKEKLKAMARVNIPASVFKELLKK